MMLIELPIMWIIILDIAAWLCIHMGSSWAVTQLDARHFDPDHPLFRSRAWEGDGNVYDRLFQIRRWKKWLPDGAALFAKGFPKKRFAQADPVYVARFIRETCRGEFAHWLVIAIAPVFFLWNYWYAGIIMIVYALAFNLPLIIVQRFNRIRLGLLLDALARKTATIASDPASGKTAADARDHFSSESAL
ncbi:MAG: glycosyl-4,4'-diaponeurosporenoate acyltransferase [Bacteroidota bacterium]|jgi:glycosyl-4,4'-diaponeurosporenoate acyltransferase